MEEEDIFDLFHRHPAIFEYFKKVLKNGMRRRYYHENKDRINKRRRELYAIKKKRKLENNRRVATLMMCLRDKLPRDMIEEVVKRVF